jgi:hypothetical protein
MLFTPPPCCLVPLRPKYSPQHPVLKHPQHTILNMLASDFECKFWTEVRYVIIFCSLLYIGKSFIPFFF